MTDEIKYEHTPFDYLDYYKCNVCEGVTNQWRLGYGMEFFRENNPMIEGGSTTTHLLKRIGLIVACSSRSTIADFLLSSRLELQIDCMRYVDIPLIAFRDLEIAALDKLSKEAAKSWKAFDSERIMSSSIELDRPIPLIRQQPWHFRVRDIPETTEERIKLNEREISYERARNGQYAKDSWYFYCGIRAIGDKVRPVL